MPERKEVYHIKDLGDGKKSMWTKIGVAFINKDGSMNAILDTLPLDGRLHIRDPKPKKEKEYDEENDHGSANSRDQRERRGRN